MSGFATSPSRHLVIQEGGRDSLGFRAQNIYLFRFRSRCFGMQYYIPEHLLLIFCGISGCIKKEKEQDESAGQVFCHSENSFLEALFLQEQLLGAGAPARVWNLSMYRKLCFSLKFQRAPSEMKTSGQNSFCFFGNPGWSVRSGEAPSISDLGTCEFQEVPLEMWTSH